jgi:hypothetical protein
MAETAAEKVARIRAELAAKRAGATAVAASTAPAPAAAAAAPPAAAPAPEIYAHIPGMTAVVWAVLDEATKALVLKQQPPPAAPAAPAAPEPPLYSRQTAPINPPDMLGGVEPPVPAEPAAAAEAPAKGTRRKTVQEPPAAPAPADATQERIATALETIAALLEVLATK